MVGNQPRILLTAWTAAFLSMSAASAFAAAGRVVALQGRAEYIRGETRALLKVGLRLEQGDVLETGPAGAARLLMADKSLLSLGPSSRIALQTYDVQVKAKTRKVSLKIFIGRLWAKITRSNTSGVNFEFKTSNAVAGVRGTEVVVSESSLTVINGTVEYTPAGANAGSSEIIGAMQQASVGTDGQVVVEQITPEQAAAIVTATQPQPELDGEGADSRLGNAEKGGPGKDAGGSTDSGADNDSGGNDSGDDNADDSEPGGGDDAPPADDPVQPDLPPLELEPSTNKARVRGRVEVRP